MRRRLRARGTQTHGISFDLLNAEFILDRFRQRHLSQPWRQRLHEDDEPHTEPKPDDSDIEVSDGGSSRANDTDLDVDEASTDPDMPVLEGLPRLRPQQRQRKGGGGLWRAFIRKETLGKQGTADLRELAKQFRTAFLLRRRPLKRIWLSSEQRWHCCRRPRAANFALALNRVNDQCST